MDGSDTRCGSHGRAVERRGGERVVGLEGDGRLCWKGFFVCYVRQTMAIEIKYCF